MRDGYSVTRNGVAAWVENSRGTMYRVLGTKDHSSNRVTIRVGLRRNATTETHKYFQIFRVAWSRNPQLQGSYYCALKAHSSAIEATRNHPLPAHGPPNLYFWMIAGDTKDTYGPFRNKAITGWPMMGPGYKMPQAGGDHKVATVHFEIRRIKNATLIPKRLLFTNKPALSLGQMRASGVPVRVEDDPLITFEFILEVLPSTEPSQGLSSSSCVTQKRIGQKRKVEVVNIVDTESEEDDEKGSDSDEGSMYAAPEPSMKRIDLSAMTSQRNKLGFASTGILKTSMGTDKGASGSSRAINLEGEVDALMIDSVVASASRKLQNVMNQQHLLTNRVLKLIEVKEKQNQELQNLLLGLENSTDAC
ncbi:hypothetical protein BJ165DRAFT_1597774 [Panaeolus papilionaceus]|nr:hypothetical protein BJ165DRAFT_1597774 [Panaeolus papilionaceus]